MYGEDDPRSTLATAAAPPAGSDAIAAAQYLDLRALQSPDGQTADERTAVVRGQNVILIHTFARSGDDLDNGTLESELAVIVTEDSPALDIITSEGVTNVAQPSLVVVPPGRSRMVARGNGPLVRLVESEETQWRSRAANAAVYEQDHPRAALLKRWPAAPDGDRVRVYPLADVPDEPGRFGRIFRTRSFMVNFLDDYQGPRDPRKLSPHTHDDFEQLSLAVRGEFIHHIRTPWLPDSTGWRDDEHVTLGSPSLAIIPPPTVHTSQARGAGINALIDIFSPPRTDFSLKPGWVLNADDYPMP